jgi:hypothetical protein
LIAAILARQDLVVKYLLKVFLQLLNQRKELGICIPILKLSSCNGILRLISSEMGLRIPMGFCRRFDLRYHVFFFCNWQVGAKTKCKVSLGAWTWDYGAGEALRLGGGAGLAEPYNEAWCAIEYWDSKGSILRMLLEYLSPNDQHNGRTLIFHAILCQNTVATKLLLAAGADAEHCIPTQDGHEF